MGKPSVIARLEKYRADGWVVAIHNDYRLHGEAYTFWLLTKPDLPSERRGRYVSGEGRTDSEAFDFIDAALEDLAALEKSTRSASADTKVWYPLSLDQIARIVCAWFGCSLSELSARTRRAEIVKPRMIAMYLCRKYTDASVAEIAAAFNRHHPSVAHAERIVESWVWASGANAAAVATISKSLEKAQRAGGA